MNAHALTAVYGTLEPVDPTVDEWIEHCAVISLAWDSFVLEIERSGEAH